METGVCGKSSGKPGVRTMMPSIIKLRGKNE
jgi:hypothetical protein